MLSTQSRPGIIQAIGPGFLPLRRVLYSIRWRGENTGGGVPSKTNEGMDLAHTAANFILEKIGMVVRVIVTRGTVWIGDDTDDASATSKKGRATSWATQRVYGVGEIITALPSIEAARLQRLGLVRVL
jgi:hypothetical protein